MNVITKANRLTQRVITPIEGENKLRNNLSQREWDLLISKYKSKPDGSFSDNLLLCMSQLNR